MSKKKANKEDQIAIDSILENHEPNVQNVVVEEGKITRYLVRNTLFRLRDDRVEDTVMATAIWDIIRPQLLPQENLHDFTFAWDVYPEEPLKVLRRSEWDEIKKEKYPLQYKKQEMVEEEITLFTGQK